MRQTMWRFATFGGLAVALVTVGRAQAPAPRHPLPGFRSVPPARLLGISWCLLALKKMRTAGVPMTSAIFGQSESRLRAIDWRFR